MALDFLRVGGVRFEVAAEQWTEERIPIGDVANGTNDLSMSGKPLESRAGVTRAWRGSTLRNKPAKDAIATNARPAYQEACMRWIEGYGQYFSLLNALSAAGVVLSGQANVVAGPKVNSGTRVWLPSSYTLRVRGGFTPTLPDGWTMGFVRQFIAGESLALGPHWCVATGAVAVVQGAAANPAGVLQYADGVAGNYNFGNLIGVAADGTAMELWGKTTANANSSIDYHAIFFLPFQLPAGWVSQINTNLIVPGLSFPRLPLQSLSGQWLVNSAAPVEVIGRVPIVHQKIGTLQGDTTSSNDLRELDLVLTEK